jgi:hypothetical protein
LPPGPDSDASVASPALAEQKAEVEETDLPKDTPTKEAEADRVVTPNDVKKPVEEEAKVAKVETQASQESVAAEATAAPTEIGLDSLLTAATAQQGLNRMGPGFVRHAAIELKAHSAKISHFGRDWTRTGHPHPSSDDATRGLFLARWRAAKC